MFGSNGYLYRESGGVLERFIRRLPDNYESNAHIKTIANPRCISYTWMPHNFVYYPGFLIINDNGNTMPMQTGLDGYIVSIPKNPENTVNNIQINHYWLKSKEEFIQKTQRGRSDSVDKHDYKVFDEIPPDTVEDRLALEIFRTPIIRREKIVDDDSTIRDLELMLGESEHNIEQLLTCFHRATRLKNSDACEKYQNAVLKKICVQSFISEREGPLFLDTLPEIFKHKTKFNSQIIKIGLNIINSLQQNARLSTSFEAYNRYINMQIFLESLL